MVYFSPINSKASAWKIKKCFFCKYITIKKKNHR